MDVTQLDEKSCFINLSGELTDSDERPLLDTCKSASNYIILDLSGVRRINGLGASMLVKLFILAKRRGQRLILCAVNEHYREVLKTIGLAPMVSIFQSRDEALIFAGATYDNVQIPDIMPVDALDKVNWAAPVNELDVPSVPPEALKRNIRGRRVVGPVDGFGQLWQKTYRLPLNRTDLTPEDVITALKQNFPSFQPDYNSFYPGPRGIAPGEVVLIDSKTPGGPVSTGVMVLYADDRSFTFITPQGHPESGWVTFSAFEENGQVVTQIQGLARANDPVYEAAFRVVGSEMQIRIWRHVLTSLASYLEVPAEITVEPRIVDPGVQWGQVGNVWYNAQIRTLLYMPFRWLAH